MLKDRECIKLPECSACSRIIDMRWAETGAWVRCCSVFTSPATRWRSSGGCEIFQIHEKRVETKADRVRKGLYKAEGRKG